MVFWNPKTRMKPNPEYFESISDILFVVLTTGKYTGQMWQKATENRGVWKEKRLPSSGKQSRLEKNIARY